MPDLLHILAAIEMLATAGGLFAIFAQVLGNFLNPTEDPAKLAKRYKRFMVTIWVTLPLGLVAILLVFLVK